MIRGCFRFSLIASASCQRGAFPSVDHHFTVSPRRNHSETSESRTSLEPTLKSYDELPGNWKNNWFNAFTFWRNSDIKNTHNLMLNNFNKYGPIYRERIGYYNSVNIINPEDAAILFRAEGIFPERLKMRAWMAYRDFRKEKYGVLLKSGEDWKKNRLILNKALFTPQITQRFVPLLNEVALDFVSMTYKEIEKSRRGKWTVDLSNDLFKFALESICHILYGERLDILQGHQNDASQRFINSISMMFKSTTPMLYIPPGLLKSINSKVWQEHIGSWDIIFAHANNCIQKTYRQFRKGLKDDRAYPGVLADLLLQDMLPLEDIRASITEIMTGAVDTTSTTLLWTMYELAKNPHIQENLRSEVVEANEKAGGDSLQMLKLLPLLRATLKETLRLHPVAITLQRYISEDIVLQNYHIPSGTLVQLGLYAMGRNAEVFSDPGRYNPERWLTPGKTNFRNLSFGFGPRQCIGRRIAEMEMLIFLIHMLQNFKIETSRTTDVKATFDLILIPDKPIILALKPIK
ncbi:cholesterol side-chain cleavage enzyme, mitochondrial-like [Leucoraja erinacea]|uniref:cholesterol side-chain cleavage enzyme, mitochondrial-like n=1 Tax=Leucoraja erinaceus TaxID=7782 RepID=UPI00245478A0|nr:cholesterol side-chain cleavage enzyme, mitochondrial-like [Leucoraja erinacea]